LTIKRADQSKNQIDLGISIARTSVKVFCAALLTALILTAAPSGARAGVVLITPDEAQLPTPKGILAPRAITRGPRVIATSVDFLKPRS